MHVAGAPVTLLLSPTQPRTAKQSQTFGLPETLAKMSVYFFIVGTGSGGPFVFVSLGLGGQLVQKQDFRPLSAGREVIICLVNIKWNTPRRILPAAQ